MTARKKHFERLAAQALLTYLSLPLEGLDDREAPDFQMLLDGLTVGIEVTKLLEASPDRGVNRRQTVTVLHRIVDAALASYAKRHHRAVDVSLDFRRGLRVNTKQASELGEAIGVQLAHKIADLGNVLFRRVPHQIMLDLPEVRVATVWPSNNTSSWRPVFAGVVRNASEADLALTVRGKEPLLSQYRRAVSQIWLAVVCDIMADGLFIDPPANPPSFTLETGFDRLFCVSWNGGYVVEVPVIAPGSTDHAA